MAKQMGAAFWTKHVEAFHRSGLPMKVYADRQGVSAKLLSAWRSRLTKDKASQPPSTATSFVALEVEAEAASPCILNFGDGIRLELNDLPAPEWLIALAKGVR